MEDFDCGQALVALYEFLDGELTFERRQTIEFHLRSCEHCLSAYDFEAELRVVMRSRMHYEVPASLLDAISSALEAEGYRLPLRPPLAPGAPPAAPPGPLGGGHPGARSPFGDGPGPFGGTMRSV
jgi:anti-sigma factor (TIGR02949 family)